MSVPRWPILGPLSTIVLGFRNPTIVRSGSLVTRDTEIPSRVGLSSYSLRCSLGVVPSLQGWVQFWCYLLPTRASPAIEAWSAARVSTNLRLCVPTSSDRFHLEFRYGLSEFISSLLAGVLFVLSHYKILFVPSRAGIPTRSWLAK